MSLRRLMFLVAVILLVPCFVRGQGGQTGVPPMQNGAIRSPSPSGSLGAGGTAHPIRPAP